MVMDFSWGWVKPRSVVTEPQAKVRVELARRAMPQAMRHPFARIRPGLERREQGLQVRLPVPAFRAQ
jgi:hypothetical protein